MYVHVLVLCCIGFVICMYVRSSAEERPCRALELKSINHQSINEQHREVTRHQGACLIPIIVGNSRIITIVRHY